MTPHESLTDFDLEHSRSRGRRWQKRVLRGVLLRWIDRIVTASELERRDSGLNEPRTVVIPHAVPEAPPRHRRRALGDPFVVGYLGRLHAKKRVDLLIRAVGAATGDVELLIAGNQPVEELVILRDQAAELGIAAQTTFLGFVPPTERDLFFDRIDVLVMPSSYECFGMAAAEGLAAGVPTIVTAETGIAEVIAEHGGGMIVPGDNAAAITSAFDTLISDPGGALARGEASRDTATQALSFDRYGARVSALYRSVIERAELSRRSARG